MKKILIAGAIALATTTAFGTSASADKPDCDWGELTAGAIAEGFPQGAHSSDPSGDGHCR